MPLAPGFVDAIIASVLFATIAARQGDKLAP